jgi:hypothetical protein
MMDGRIPADSGTQYHRIRTLLHGKSQLHSLLHSLLHSQLLRAKP